VVVRHRIGVRPHNPAPASAGLHEESRGPFEVVDVLPQPAVLPPQPRQLVALIADRPGLTDNALTQQYRDLSSADKVAALPPCR
jgi:hypothetical protein